MTYIAVWRLPKPDAVRLTDTLADRLAATADMTRSRRLADWIVTAYFDARPDPRILDDLCRRAIGRNAAAVRVSELTERDWVARSLAGLGPVVAGRYFVHGRHDRDRRPANAIAIEIEAATAFGTGHHGTTAGCLAALSDLAKRYRFRSALDIGTGSGILAIAAAKTWRAPVIATDIDPDAIRVAGGNSRLNGVAHHVKAVTADGVRHPAIARFARFDLVTANILAGPLVTLAPPIAAHLAPGGVAILSGLLPAQRRQVAAAYRARGLVLRRASIREGWLTMVFERPAFAGAKAAA
jgi:ribosomal protein L11 methyltransferase